MTPDAKYEERRMKKELDKLNNTVKKLSTDERKEIFTEG